MIEYVPITDSTNSEIKRRSAAGNAEPGSMLVAGAQTGGRGQRVNSWQSGAGEGLFATLFLQPEHLSIGSLPLVVKASALAVVDVLEQLPGHALNPQIKCPTIYLCKEGKSPAYWLSLQSVVMHCRSCFLVLELT